MPNESGETIPVVIKSSSGDAEPLVLNLSPADAAKLAQDALSRGNPLRITRTSADRTEEVVAERLGDGPETTVMSVTSSDGRLGSEVAQFVAAVEVARIDEEHRHTSGQAEQSVRLEDDGFDYDESEFDRDELYDPYGFDIDNDDDDFGDEWDDLNGDF